MLKTAIAAVLAIAPSAFAWNAMGHESVAVVAWDALTPDDRAKLVAVLDQHPRRDKDLKPSEGINRGRDLFAMAATWPDIIRTPTNPMSHTEHQPTWHYVDFPMDAGGVHGPVPVETWDGHSAPANLLQALAKNEADFTDPKSAPQRKAIALCWIEHLIGDEHQPLHTISFYSPDYPTGDRGGNERIVAATYSNHTNLHSVWDGLEGLGNNVDRAQKVADRSTAAHPKSEFTDALAETEPAKWAHEVNAIAVRDAYLGGSLPGTPSAKITRGADAPPLPIGYEKHAHDIADKQVALAGYRLAATLDRLLASIPATRP